MFDQKIDRSGSGSLKGTFLSPEAVAAGVPGYWGAEFEFPTCPAFSEGVIRCAQSGYYPFTLLDGGKGLDRAHARHHFLAGNVHPHDAERK